MQRIAAAGLTGALNSNRRAVTHLWELAIHLLNHAKIIPDNSEFVKGGLALSLSHHHQRSHMALCYMYKSSVDAENLFGLCISTHYYSLSTVM